MKIHLVDGTYELFRHFYGAPPFQSPDGQEVGATRGLLRSMLALLNKEGATHVAIAFDTVIESFRNDLFDGYKTGEGIDEDLHKQFPLAEQACQALGLVVWPMRDHEADDALATGAARWGQLAEVEEVLLCSPDKDLMQCVVDDRIVVLDRRRKKRFGKDQVLDKFGVPPASIPDFLALVGDAADGIPGVPKWGEKSAAAVLRAYGNLENIPADPEQWKAQVRGKKNLSAQLESMRTEAALYKKLATLIFDVPLKETLDDLKWRGAHRKQLEPICTQLRDEALLDRVGAWAPSS